MRRLSSRSERQTPASLARDASSIEYNNVTPSSRWGLYAVAVYDGLPMAAAKPRLFNISAGKPSFSADRSAQPVESDMPGRNH